MLNTFSTRLDYLGTVRGRSATCSIARCSTQPAVSPMATSATRRTSSDPPASCSSPARNSKIETGYTVGGGIEHAFAPNWTVKGEYLYYDLGRNTVNVAVIPGSGGGGTGYNRRSSNNGHIGRIGMNYKFGPM